MQDFEKSLREFEKEKKESYSLLNKSYTLPKINLSTLRKTKLEAFIQKLESIKSYNEK